MTFKGKGYCELVFGCNKEDMVYGDETPSCEVRTLRERMGGGRVTEDCVPSVQQGRETPSWTEKAPCTKNKDLLCWPTQH